ncbi:MAG: vanadium-dependent haloperoxidase, partial [Chloroflexota bacterium]|nr:vanadium-dependent haloperoxidase [Chloroflexota bacterium]
FAPAARHERAYRIRTDAAARLYDLPLSGIPRVTDEELYPSKIGTFTKGLPHDALGEVNPFAYQALAQAVNSGDPAAFEDIPMGGAAKLQNPQAGLAFGLIGPDSHQLTMPFAPSLASAEAAAEMGELYWQALLRDVPFSAYGDDPRVAVAAADLSMFSDFRGPKSLSGDVPAAMLFRATVPGVLSGPFVSQFLLKDLPTAGHPGSQQIRTVLPLDHLASYDDWLTAQDGTIPPLAPIYDPVRRYIRNGRDLAEAVHWDWPGQAVHQACLLLFGVGASSLAGLISGDATLPVNPAIPYVHSDTQAGFATFGLADITSLVGLATGCALKAAWYQKWFVHRRLRPEEFGGRVHHASLDTAAYPLHKDLLARSTVLSEVGRRFGTNLLPQGYPEGCPIHPAYPSGHATWAGAGVTVLKAFFDESVIIADPVVAADDGLTLVPYTGPDAGELTLGGELNKLAWNVGVGRTFAGIHWRTDATEGLRLGEAVALGILRDLRGTYNEDFVGHALTSFDGRRVTI